MSMSMPMLTDCCIQTALFNFQSLLLVILLIICTSTYAHSVVPGIMDRHQNGYACPSLQCSSSTTMRCCGYKTHIRVFSKAAVANAVGVVRKTSVLGIFWKCARVGERLSPYVSLCCIAMAVSIYLCIPSLQRRAAVGLPTNYSLSIADVAFRRALTLEAVGLGRDVYSAPA